MPQQGKDRCASGGHPLPKYLRLTPEEGHPQLAVGHARADWRRTFSSLGSCLALGAFSALVLIAAAVLITWTWSGTVGARSSENRQSLRLQAERLFQWEKAHLSIGSWLFFAILVLLNVINLTVLIPLFAVFLRRRCTVISQEDLRGDCEETCPEITALIPCYLPNEQSIIQDTVNHIVEKLESPGALNVCVVYNTPQDLPDIERKLLEMSERTYEKPGRQVSVMRVHDSKSKAENLNAAVAQVSSPYVVIYDADHHPDPESLLLLYNKLRRDALDCVQGSTYIRNLCAGFLGRFVDAEFFIIHFVYFPALQLFTRLAVFGGSNALWKTDVLAARSFDHNMQTEDIDLSIGFLLERRRIDYCPEARSGELAPASWRALYKQRLRWAIGWDQVSLKYMRSVFYKSSLPCWHRMGLVHILYTRWLLLFMGVLTGVINSVLHLIWEPEVRSLLIGAAQMTLFGDYVFVVTFGTIEAICQVHHRGLQSWVQALFVLVYFVVNAPVMVLQAMLVLISLLKIATGRVGGWVVTERGTSSGATLLMQDTSKGESMHLDLLKGETEVDALMKAVCVI